MKKKLFTLLTLLLCLCSGAWASSGTITAAATTDLGSGKTPRYVVEQEGVGRLMKNKTGSSTNFTIENLWLPHIFFDKRLDEKVYAYYAK